MEEYSIKDLETLSGIKAHTIRIWEKRYGIIKPTRTATNRRRYSDEDLKNILNISILNRHGIKISKIAGFSAEEIRKRVSMISSSPGEVDTLIEAMIVSMIDLDEKIFSEIIAGSVETIGFENTFTGIVFPFLRRVGVLWVTATINPAQEHFVTNIIRQKLISQIDRCESPVNIKSKRVLLFLPEKELHEIGLLFYSYIIKKQGHELLYLGQMTPLDAVKLSFHKWPADIIVTGTVSGYADVDEKSYLAKLSDSFRNRKVIITGRLALVNGFKLPSNIIAVHTLEEFEAQL